MKTKQTVELLPPLTKNKEAEQHLVSEILNEGPLAIHDSLQQVHDMALYRADELSKDEIAALWYVHRIRNFILHFADAVGDKAE